MRWSKLKQNIEIRFAPELRDRVAVQVTRYRKAHDDEGEFWLMLDGQKIYGSSFYRYVRSRIALGSEQLTVSSDEIGQQLRSEGITDHREIVKALFVSLNQSIDDMLASPHPLLRSLAILDMRCGKRRMEKIDFGQEHWLVRTAHALRVKEARQNPITLLPPAASAAGSHG